MYSSAFFLSNEVECQTIPKKESFVNLLKAVAFYFGIHFDDAVLIEDLRSI